MGLGMQGMRYPVSENLEIIHIVENGHLSIKKILDMLVFIEPLIIAGIIFILQVGRTRWQTKIKQA
jgi:uncharacterized protein (UPF0210 family)